MVYQIQAPFTDLNTINVSQWINQFQTQMQLKRIELGQYYDGYNVINKQGAVDGRPNYQVNVNMSKYIADVATGYAFGKPISYATNDEEKTKNTLDKILYINKNANTHDVDFQVGSDMAVYGVGYQLVMIKDGNEPIEDRIIVKRLNPENTFLVVDSSILMKPLYGVYFYTYNLKNIQYTRVYVYDKENLTIFNGTIGNLQVEQPAIPHFMGDIPILQTLNNDKGFGDFQQVQGLLDSLSLAVSNCTDNLQSIANAILAVYGATLSEEEIKIVNQYKVMQMQGNGSEVKAEWLIKDINPQGEQMQIDNLLKFIFQISQVPDLTDEAFGGNQSGVAMQYKLWGINQLWVSKVREYKQTIYKRLSIFINLLKYQVKSTVQLIDDIDVIFYKNLPTDKSEEYEMVKNLKGTVSEKFLLSNISGVEDVEAEMEQIQKEKEAEADTYGFDNNGAVNENAELLEE